MATYALQAVGTYFGGPVGGAIGAVIGGFIDQALFGPGDQEGPRITDLNVTTSTYGTPIPLIYGPENRLAGNIIWSTDLVEHKKEEGGKGGGPSYTTYSYSVSCAIAFSGRKVSRLKRIWANNKVIYDIANAAELPAVSDTEGQIVTKYYLDTSVSPDEYKKRGTHSLFDELHFYNGSATQNPDTFIESFEGVGEVPGYRNTAYCVITNLQLADFGNRIPNFEFEVEADASIDSAQIVQDMMTRAGITEYSIFGLNESVRGYLIGRQSPVYQAILPLGISFDFEATEQRGFIGFVRKSRGMKGTVRIDRMGGKDATAGFPTFTDPIELKNVSSVYMPDQVSITFKDPAMDYQMNTQTAFRSRGSATNKITQEIPIVIPADKARQIADRLLWGAWANKQNASFNLDDTYVRINPGDVYGIPALDEILPMKIVRTSRGDNGVIEMEATYEDPEIYSSQQSGVAGLAIRQNVRVPGATILEIMDAPLLNDSDSDFGFYWSMTSDNAVWRGAAFLRSVDGGETYSEVRSNSLSNPIGDVSGTLASGPTEVFDNTNTLTVTFPSSLGVLESKSELNVLAGQNAAWVGPRGGGAGEVIQFKTATLIGTNQYQLSGLLRGRLGTEHKVGSHTSGEVFVILQQGTVLTSNFGISDWDRERSYKAVTFLDDVSVVEGETFTNTGIRAKPLSPVHVKGSRDGSDNLTITWLRRTRKSVPGLGYGEVPLGETTEAYEIDIMSGATVLRTISATSETATYTAAQQTTDGLTPGDPVTVNIYQVSSTRGRGYAAEATI